MMRLALLSLLLTGIARAGDPVAGSKGFEGWTATCNNLGACVVIASNEDDRLFYLRIARDAGATAGPSLKVVTVAQTTIGGDVKAFRLTAKDAGKAAPLGPFAAAHDSELDSFTAKVDAGETALAVIDAIRNAATLDYAIGEAKGTLDLKGLSAALRFIDARQGRAGTPTALVARGMTPIGQVPPPREPPVVTRAPAGSATEIIKPQASRAVLAAAAASCDADVVKAHEGIEAWRLGPAKILVAVPCTAGAYNFVSALYLTDAKGGAPQPVILLRPPGAVGEGAPDNMATNATFDVKTMTLQSFDKGRGIADCGTLTTWVWTGAAFVLLEANVLEACPGALPDDWPSLYVAKPG